MQWNGKRLCIRKEAGILGGEIFFFPLVLVSINSWPNCLPDYISISESKQNHKKEDLEDQTGYNPFQTVTNIYLSSGFFASAVKCIVRFYLKRSKKDRGSEGPGLALLAKTHTDFMLEREDLGTLLLLYPGRMFRQGN
jgi:hypothetical protein